MPSALLLLLLQLPDTGVVHLPAGMTEVAAEILLPAGAHDLEIRGDPAGSVLKMAKSFQGRALFVAEGARRVRFTNFSVDGNREALEQRQDLPPSNQPFAGFTRNNGILADDVEGLDVRDVRFHAIAGFAVLVSRSCDVHVERVRVESSGSRNAKGRNNTTGGILFEEGTKRFRATANVLDEIRGNGIWTHSLYTSPRNSEGEISDNRFREIGRDAIQAGHATRIVVEHNSGARIGFPEEIVDIENQAVPVALDTSGNVDHSIYADNHFEQIAKCIDLDGFHDGEVRGNTCRDLSNYGIVMNNYNPDMRPERVRITGNVIDGAAYGGIFVIGTDNLIAGNQLLHLNRSHSGDRILRTGIYLGNGPARPVPNRNNTIRDNRISGYGMRAHCVAAAEDIKISQNRLARNLCSDRR